MFRAPAPVLLALGAGIGLAATGCTSVTAACAVRHRYAVVVFQSSIGENTRRVITHFRLTVRYGPGQVTRRVVWTHVVLRTAQGGNGNPPLVIRTFRVGDARSCRADQIRSRR